jgi:hypothetical protein
MFTAPTKISILGQNWYNSVLTCGGPPAHFFGLGGWGIGDIPTSATCCLCILCLLHHHGIQIPSLLFVVELVAAFVAAFNWYTLWRR